MRRMFSKTGASMGLHVGCKVTVALKLQRHLQSKPSVAPEPPKAAPVAPEPPKAAPVAPEPPKAAPVAPEPPKAAPVAPEPPKAAPVAPEPPKAAPVAPEPPKAAPVAPEPPKAAPVAPEPPKAAPVAPEPPKAAPVAPEPPKAAPVAPEPPKAAPVAPEPPKAAPVAPEPPKAAPVAPEPPKAAPVAPEPPKAAPVAPEPPKAAPVAPEPPKAAPVAPEPPKAAPVAPEPPKAAPVAPEPPKAAPVAPEPPKAAPVAPEPPKAAPVAPEPPKAAPVAPEPPKAAPVAPEPPKAAPVAPEPPKAAPVAPEPPKAAPVAPEPPKAAPVAPEPPKAAPVAPEPPKAAPVAPEPPKAAPVAPEPPKAGNKVLVSSRASDRRSSVKGSAKHGDQRRGGEYGNRRQEKLGASFGVLGKKTPFAAGDRNKQLSMGKIIDDVGEIKVVFTQRGKAQSPPLHPSPPPPPPPPPSAPAPPTASQTSVSSSSASTQFAGGTSEKPSGVVNTGVVEGVEDDLFFNIARNTKAEGSQVSVLLKSFGVLVDEEIENARALRPLVRPADISQDTDEKLKLNVVGGNEEERTVETVVDKEKLGSLSEEEAAGIERHEIPHVIGGPANITAESMNTKEVPEDGGKIKHSVTTTDSKLEDRGGSSLLSDETPTPLLNDIMAGRVPVEQAPLAPWTTKGRMNENESMPCARVSYDNVSHVASILLEEQPTHILSLVNFLHQTISVIDNHHTAAGTRTDVVFMTLPMVDFFKPKHGPLELTSGERVELLRAKERLLARMESASSRLRFVANAHGDMVEDFGAELFLACQHRVLLDTTHATFGFPSIQFGEFPAPSTVRRLSYFFGSQRCIEIAPKLHEYSVESIMNTGIIEGEDVTAPSPPSFLLRLERRLLALVSRPTHREFLLRKLFFTTEFDTSTTMTSPNPLVKAWGEYSMSVIAQGNGTTNNNGLTTMRREETKPESIFGKLVYTSPAINAANVYALGCEMKRRVLPLLPSRCFITFRREEMHQWEEKMKALVSAKDNCAVALLDCSQRCMDATLKMVKTHHDMLKGVNVVLIGEEHVAQPVLSTLPCGVVVSCASPYRVSSLGALQEVRLFAHEKCPKETSDTILTAALTYLQKEEKPYVVCRGPCSKRLIASLMTEACRLTQQCDVASIDRAATDVLHLLVGPFHLIDYFGPVAVLRMLNETDNMNTQNNPLQVDCLPAIARHTLQCMSTDGYLGVNSRRGGFFSYREDGTPIALNTEVPRRYFSRYLSDTVVADRLLAVVVNECCELILSGHVLSATDANALTIAAIGFRETTGGALALADTIGISTLVQKMEDMSNWYGPHLRPSSLLKCMAHSKVSFASLSDAMIQSARM